MIYALFFASSALSQLRAFWETLLAKIWWWGALEHFNAPGSQWKYGWKAVRNYAITGSGGNSWCPCKVSNLGGTKLPHLSLCLKTTQYICLNLNTSSSRLIFFPLIHFLSIVSFGAWFEPGKKCDDFDGVHIILLLGICNLLVFSPSLQSIYLSRTNERRRRGGSRPIRSQGSVSCRIRGRAVLLWEASIMLHALHLLRMILSGGPM